MCLIALHENVFSSPTFADGNGVDRGQNGAVCDCEANENESTEVDLKASLQSTAIEIRFIAVPNAIAMGAKYTDPCLD
jgi:hypothetical protein